jgi:hypothetical protein
LEGWCWCGCGWGVSAILKHQLKQQGSNPGWPEGSSEWLLLCLLSLACAAVQTAKQLPKQRCLLCTHAVACGDDLECELDMCVPCCASPALSTEYGRRACAYACVGGRNVSPPLMSGWWQALASLCVATWCEVVCLCAWQQCRVPPKRLSGFLSLLFVEQACKAPLAYRAGHGCVPG